MSTPITAAPPVGAADVPPGNRSLLRDTSIVMLRELRPVLRDPFSLIFGMIQPLVFLALFGPLLVGSLGGQAGAAFGGSVWQWFVPAILVMTALFGTSTTGPTCCSSSRPEHTSECLSRRCPGLRC
jgi:ABC-2 type transport system permease protein